MIKKCVPKKERILMSYGYENLFGEAEVLNHLAN